MDYLPPFASKPLLVFLAGGAGSLARYWTSGVAQRFAGAQFPVGTLCVNFVGSLLIGFLASALVGRWAVREEFRVMVIAGFLGGYTTFSAFAYETFKLVGGRQYGLATLNVGLSLGLGLVGVWFGTRAAERWLGV